MQIIFDNEVDAQKISFTVSNHLAKKVLNMIWDEWDKDTRKRIGKECGKF